MNYHGDSLEYWMKREVVEAPEWSEPECYDPNNVSDRRGMYSRVVMGGAKVQRKVAAIAEDLFEMKHPDQKNNQTARERFVEPISAEGDRYGKWYYFPWSNQLVQYPDREEHRLLLTFRNRELITADELRKIGSATTAHIGLSVGSHILEQTSHMALGDKVILADPDVMSVPNLNRINAGMPEVGMRKTDVAGIRLSELNPYVKQVHLFDGITSQNAEVVARHHPDLIFEEVDHMPTKILMRKLAYRVGAALIMATDTGDLTMIDVERYDLGDVKPFLGRLTTNEMMMIEEANPSPEQTVRLIIKLIGLENISMRLAQSLGQIGITLGGIAQLGTTASTGAAYAAVAGREILLKRGPTTGRYKVSPQEVLHL
ncbi:MAG: ThiF family adenylyltransferase [Candidatus Nomurabacteria bacterium]|nr:MAG: ThiF family adenylyltransferase [Candidatus Nomurabacteria bacterium]